MDGGGYVLKEKLKMIKVALKEWLASHTQNLPRKILDLQERMAALDGKGEVEVLRNALFIYLIILLENIVYYYILYDFLVIM